MKLDFLDDKLLNSLTEQRLKNVLKKVRAFIGFINESQICWCGDRECDYESKRHPVDNSKLESYIEYKNKIIGLLKRKQSESRTW